MTEEEHIRELKKTRYRKAEKMKWYEDRKPDDLPRYIKALKDEDYKNEMPSVWKLGDEFKYGFDDKGFAYIANFHLGGGLLLDYTLPATSAEYNKFINWTKSAKKSENG